METCTTKYWHGSHYSRQFGRGLSAVPSMSGSCYQTAPRGGTRGTRAAGTLHTPGGWHCYFSQCTGRDDGHSIIWIYVKCHGHCCISCAERKMDKYIVYTVFIHGDVLISIILTVNSLVNQYTSHKYKAIVQVMRSVCPLLSSQSTKLILFQ